MSKLDSSRITTKPSLGLRIDGVKGEKIDGVVITHKRTIPDERGVILHMLKATDPEFDTFGEIYFSCGYPGVVKAWHIHKEMTLNNFCVVGMLKLVLYDGRKGSPTEGATTEIFMGEQNRLLVTIPPGITNGYKAFGDKPAVLANCATMPHDPDELIYIDPFDNTIPYDWSLKHG